jgi:NADPH2:quinone reductase
MKAIRVSQNGDNSVLKLQDIPTPQPGAGEALIRLKTAGINFADIYMRIGRRPAPLPFTPGLEGAGIVETVGAGVTEVKPGDRVAYAGQLGSYAEYAAVKASQLIPLPDEISFVQAAAFPLQGMTAHYLVHEFYNIKPGDNILVHAAAGGVGLLLVQMLKHMGARVIGTVSTDEKAKIARAAGADEIIIYTRQEFVAEVKNLTNGKGADYIIDGVGRDTFTKDLDAARIRGCICLFGSASGPAEPLAPNSLQAKSLTICGGMLGNFTGNREELLKRSHDVLGGVRDGWLKLNIDRVLSLDQAAEAQRLLENRETSGKVILKIGD